MKSNSYSPEHSTVRLATSPSVTVAFSGALLQVMSGKRMEVNINFIKVAQLDHLLMLNR